MALKAKARPRLRRKTLKRGRGRRAHGTRGHRMQRGGADATQTWEGYRITGSSEGIKEAIQQLESLQANRKEDRQQNLQDIEALIEQMKAKNIIIEEVGKEPMPGAPQVPASSATTIPLDVNQLKVGEPYPISSNLSRNHSTLTWGIYKDAQRGNRYYTDIVLRVGRRHYYFRIYSAAAAPEKTEEDAKKELLSAIVKLLEERKDLTIFKSVKEDLIILKEVIKSNQLLINNIFTRSTLEELRDAKTESATPEERALLDEYEKAIKEYNNFLIQEYSKINKKT